MKKYIILLLVVMLLVCGCNSSYWDRCDDDFKKEITIILNDFDKDIKLGKIKNLDLNSDTFAKEFSENFEAEIYMNNEDEQYISILVYHILKNVNNRYKSKELTKKEFIEYLKAAKRESIRIIKEP